MIIFHKDMVIRLTEGSEHAGIFMGLNLRWVSIVPILKLQEAIGVSKWIHL